MNRGSGSGNRSLINNSNFTCIDMKDLYQYLHGYEGSLSSLILLILYTVTWKLMGGMASISIVNIGEFSEMYQISLDSDSFQDS